MSSSDARPSSSAAHGAPRTWSRWLVALLVTIVAVASVISAWQIAVDPFGVWRVKRIAGFNNYKRSQKVARLSKPYQYARLEPDVVFLGDSRVSFGMPAEWPGYPAKKVFNFGLDDLQAPEAERIVQFMIDTHRPKILALGVDMLLFSNRPSMFSADYSEERLGMAAFSAATRGLWQLRETAFSIEAIKRAWQTVSDSRRRPRHILIDRLGYYRFRGESKGPDRTTYTLYLWSYVTSRYRTYAVRRDSLRAFQRTVAKAKKAGIDVRLFFVPKSADFMTIVDLDNKWGEFERIKREAVKTAPLWDFATVNSVTADRRNYIDGSHFLGKVGRQVVARMSGRAKDVPADFGVLLNAANVERELGKARPRFTDHKLRNDQLVQILRAAIRRGNRKRFDAQIAEFLVAHRGR